MYVWPSNEMVLKCPILFYFNSILQSIWINAEHGSVRYKDDGLQLTMWDPKWAAIYIYIYIYIQAGALVQMIPSAILQIVSHHICYIYSRLVYLCRCLTWHLTVYGAARGAYMINLNLSSKQVKMKWC